MDLGLRGRKALVTGGSKGIGRATAEILAEEGCDVVLVSRNEADLAAAAGAIRAKHNVRVETVPADLSASDSIARLTRAHPDVDLLVNNAGAIPGGSLQEIDEARWRAAWDLKVFGYVNMCRAYYALMQGRGGGVIINIIGIGGESLDPGYICGAAGNASLMAFTRCLGSVSFRDNIRVVGINPGPVATERLETLMRKKARDRTGSEENWKALFEPLPFGRAATSEEIGAMVAMLASDRSAYTSGTIVTIDGGIAGAGRSF